MRVCRKEFAKMANIAKTDKDLQEKQDILTGVIDKDARQYTFSKKVSIGGEEREGSFTYRYPTIGDRLKQGILQSTMLDGRSPSGLDVVTYNIAFAMSYLRSTLVQAPAWFDFDQMDSVDELIDMFREVEAFADSFRSKDGKASNAAGGKAAPGQKAVATR